MGKSIRAALAALWLGCAVAGLAVQARAETSPPAAEDAAERALLASLHPRNGVVALPSAEASLNLGDRYDFLDAADAKRVLTEGWSNPPSAADGVLGMIFPHGRTFRDKGVWAAVISYEQTFYVSDKAVGQSDYDKLLAEMKSDAASMDEERKKGGFDVIRVVGWAEPPTYDRAAHNLVWARDLKFGDAKTDTLNYDVRHLGRRGVLSLNIVGEMPQLAEIHQAAHGLAATAEFQPGARYADHTWTDKSAGYGLVGLVAAGAGLVVAKKLGLVALLALFAKKGIVVIGAVGVAIANWARRTFGGKARAAKAGTPTALPAPIAALGAPDETALGPD